MEAESTSTQTQGAAVDTYNKLLASKVDAFKANNSGVTAWVFDTAAPFNEAINNPKINGALNENFYNGDGTSCLWFNNYHYHPGQAIHKLVAAGVATLVGL